MDVHLELEKLTALRVLGRGAMGTVFLVADRSPAGRHAASNSTPPRGLFALKVVQKPPSPGAKPDAARRARWEVSVLGRLSPHPFLPSLLGRVETPDLVAWALPYCPGGDLNALRHSHSAADGVFSPSATRFYLCEVLLALSHLHSLRIVYRDLKPENLLVQASGHLLLTDFDLSCHLPAPPVRPPPSLAATTSSSSTTLIAPPAPDYKRPGRTKPKPKSARVSPANRRRSSADDTGDPTRAGERSNSFVGTEEYVAPEVLRGDGHGFAVDWWSLGVLAYEMAYGRTPFRGRTREETFANILTRRPEFAGGRRSDDLTDLIEGLLAKDPAHRLGSRGGAEEVKAHPFFRGVRWELLAEVARPPFLAPSEDDEEEHTCSLATAAARGFSVADYFKKLQQQPPTAPGSPSPSPSMSLAEF